MDKKQKSISTDSEEESPKLKKRLENEKLKIENSVEDLNKEEESLNNNVYH